MLFDSDFNIFGGRLNLKNSTPLNYQLTKKAKKMYKKHVDITMTDPYLSAMNQLIKDGIYESQSEIIKDALRRLFQHYEIELISEPSEVKEVVSVTF